MRRYIDTRFFERPRDLNLYHLIGGKSRLGVLVFLLWAQVAVAQTAAQLQLFNQLPASERQRVMKQFGLDGQTTTTGNPIQQAGEVVIPEPAAETSPAPFDARKKGEEGLKPFGYQLFRSRPTTFAPVSDAPVPADYVLGPGDKMQLGLFGAESGTYTLEVDRTGQVFLPEIGPVTVAGLRFVEAREVLLKRVAESRIGVTATLAMGELRSIRIFVAGDARNPGSYTVGGLATMTQALYVSGGVQEIGSLRRVQLNRGGKRIAELDLYDLLLRGDSSSDARLQAGDVVFIPPVGKTVSVSGAVRRPAIYELRDEKSLQEVLALAGGTLPGALRDRVTVQRVEDGRRFVTSASAVSGRDGLTLRAGDQIEVRAPMQDANDAISLNGPAYWPGAYAADSSVRFTDLLRSADDLKPLSDLDFALILRRSADGSSLVPVYLNPRRAFAGQIEADERLVAGDEVHVFSAIVTAEEGARTSDQARGKLSSAEQRLAKSLGLSEVELARQKRDSELQAGSSNAELQDNNVQQPNADGAASQEQKSVDESQPWQRPSADEALSQDLEGDEQDRATRQQRMDQLVARLKALAREGRMAPIIDVVGAVRFPGEVPLDSTRNTVADVIRAVGGLAENAETGFVEISRAPSRASGTATATRMILRVDSEKMGSVRLFPGDTVAVRSVPGAADSRTVSILGEVLYPGAYRVAEGTTLAELVERAGGITRSGFPQGAVFTRDDLRRKEEEQVQRLRDRLRGDLAAAALTKAASSPQGAAGLQTLGALFDELAQYQALGRLVIDLEAQTGGRAAPLVIEDGDTLIIPKTPEEVTVVGEVQFPTSHRWEPGVRAAEYLRRSGGGTNMADEKRAFIVRANGSVESARGGLFRLTPVLQPGDLIVVPLDATPIEPLTLFSSVTQIIYQLALTVAAFNSVGAF